MGESVGAPVGVGGGAAHATVGDMVRSAMGVNGWIRILSVGA
jgi:hypothetical protein